MRLPRAAALAFLPALLLMATPGALAQNATNPDLPRDGAISMREAASPIADQVHQFHNWIMMPVMVGISVFVALLLLWLIVRYNAKANKIASQFSHSTGLEVAWTVIPVFILLFIALFSFDLLYLEGKMPDAQVYEYAEGNSAAAFPNDFPQGRRISRLEHLEVELVDLRTGDATLLSAAGDYDVDGFGSDQLVIQLAQAVPAGHRLRVTGGRSRVGVQPFLGLFGEDRSQIVPAPSITIKATGFQWGWSYEYPDFGTPEQAIEFDALVAPRDSVPAELFRLATTNDVVIPAGETVRLVTTARDVIHSWAMPAFAVKVDSVPGRLNETWFYSERLGTYYGQCSEICGIDHAFMPISVRVVPRPEFEAWVDAQREAVGLEPFFATTGRLAEAASAASVN